MNQESKPEIRFLYGETNASHDYDFKNHDKSQLTYLKIAGKMLLTALFVSQENVEYLVSVDLEEKLLHYSVRVKGYDAIFSIGTVSFAVADNY